MQSLVVPFVCRSECDERSSLLNAVKLSSSPAFQRFRVTLVARSPVQIRYALETRQMGILRTMLSLISLPLSFNMDTCMSTSIAALSSVGHVHVRHTL